MARRRILEPATPADDVASWAATAPKKEEPKSAKKKNDAIPIPHDYATEVSFLAAAVKSTALVRKYAGRLPPDHFLVRDNSEAWAALVDLARQAIEYDPDVVRKLHGDRIANHLIAVSSAREGREMANVDWHVQTIIWDRA